MITKYSIMDCIEADFCLPFQLISANEEQNLGVL